MKERIQHLRNEINRHNNLYYKQNNPEISDHTYDAIFAKLAELETEYPEYADPNSPTAHIGSDTTNRFQTYPHPTPMPSIQSFFTTEALEKALRAGNCPPDFRGAKPRKRQGGSQNTYYITPKYDGIAIELHYHNNRLTRALTRGNGTSGNDVTTNIRTIHEIPKHINTETCAGAVPLSSGGREASATEGVVVRGEIFLTQKEFKRLNKRREKQDIEQYKSIRSAAASLVKAKQSSTTAAANLSARFFWATTENCGDKPLPTEEAFELLATHFRVPPLFVANDMNDIVNIVNTKQLAPEGTPTDGVVIKTPFTECRENTRYQLGAWALKNNSPVWETTLRCITYNVSNKGKLTAIAHFQPFTESGATFFKAKLPTLQTVQQLNLHPGATIHVQITGNTVPHVIESFSAGNCPPDFRGAPPRKRQGGTDTATETAKLPTHCPSCHQPLTTTAKGPRCTNNTWCPSRGNYLTDIKQHIQWPVEIDIPKLPNDGPGLYRAATTGLNALIVRTSKQKHDLTLLADSLKTVQQVAIRAGNFMPGPHRFERETEDDILKEAQNAINQSNKLLNLI